MNNSGEGNNEHRIIRSKALKTSQSLHISQRYVNQVAAVKHNLSKAVAFMHRTTAEYSALQHKHKELQKENSKLVKIIETTNQAKLAGITRLEKQSTELLALNKRWIKQLDDREEEVVSNGQVLLGEGKHKHPMINPTSGQSTELQVPDQQHSSSISRSTTLVLILFLIMTGTMVWVLLMLKHHYLFFTLDR